MKIVDSDGFGQIRDVASQSGGSIGLILQLVLIVANFYILLLRPQQKRIKQHEAMVSAVKNGDMVVTGGGIYAKVIDASDAVDLSVEISPNVVVKVNRGNIREVGLPEDKSKNVKAESKKSKTANANKKSY